MEFTYIGELKAILVKELKVEQLDEKALEETWRVLNSPSNQGHEVTKEHLVNYYTTCLRFEQLKDNI
jgi:hypothetical protein